MVLVIRIGLGELVLDVVEAGCLRRPKHYVGGDIEYLVRWSIWLLFDVEFEWLEGFGIDAGNLSLGIHLE